MKKAQNRLTYIDLFAGCGGLSEGFMATGKYEALAHVEWELPMVNTLRNRLIQKWKHNEEEADKSVVHFDIQKSHELINGNWGVESIEKYGKTNHNVVQEKGLRGIIGKKNVDLIIGGPPCQAYSVAGRAQDKNSMKDDYRNYLFESFVKVVDEFNPIAFVFENVPGLLSACPGDIAVTDRIHKAFKEIGYEIKAPNQLKEAVYTASNFGVPQKRNRVIIIGIRKNSNVKLNELYDEINKIQNTNNIKTLYDAIGSLPKITPLKNTLKENGKNVSHIQLKGDKIKYHEPRFHNQTDISTFYAWIKNDMNSKSNEEKIAIYNKLKGKNSNHIKYRSLEWDKPSPTIVAHLYKDGLMFIHPDIEQARSITVKEAALLQSFPDDYEFIGSSAYAFKMIGNAVPPKMSELIANSIFSKINGGE
jgi:DNA (cytosine-5)-methyltransferase 1